MLKRFQSWIARFPRHARYLAGVSGGLDSVTLLHILVQLGYTKLIVCHLNHKLRGRAAAADARFVQKLAASLGLEFEGATADVRALAKSERLSLEAAGRVARHRFFHDCARKRRCKAIFLAHHADDQAETVLFNLFRGSGLAGLAGMAESSPLSIAGSRRTLTLLRPLLNTTREELAAWAAERGIAHRHDATNDSPNHTRNRIRRQLLPAASEILQRDVRPALVRLAEIARAEDEFAASAAAKFPLTARLPVKELRALAAAQQRRVLHAWLKKIGAAGIGFDLIESVRALLAPRATTAAWNISGRRRIRRTAGWLYVDAD